MSPAEANLSKVIGVTLVLDAVYENVLVTVKILLITDCNLTASIVEDCVIVTAPLTMLMLLPRATAASRVDALEIVNAWLYTLLVESNSSTSASIASISACRVATAEAVDARAREA
jgi:hypothetical protein